MINVCRYESSDKAVWDEFIKNSKNGTFLFKRDYMEYHADRFTDCSLMFRDENDKLNAVLPANRKDDTLISHGGLTFGGVVSGDKMKTPQMLEIFESLTEFARQKDFKRIIYKAVPHIYHRQPAEEDLYSLFRRGARLVRRDVSTTVQPKEKLRFSKGRKWATAQSRKNEIDVCESEDFEAFMHIEAELLAKKYDAVPVHTPTEINSLANLFPENIHLFGAFRDEEMLAGVIVYDSQTATHAQYIASSDDGKKVFALDAVLNYLITSRYAEKKFFDFGISTEQQGRYLNNGLINFKESWGGRATVYDTYEIGIA